MSEDRTHFSHLTVEEIRAWLEEKAFELYQSRDRQTGHDWDDWFNAEKILVQEIIRNNF